MSNFLITGGAGFIGTNLTNYFTAQGHAVRVLDNFSTGFHSNLAALSYPIDIITGDVSDLPTVQSAMADMDYVIHLAAWRAVGRSIDNPLLAHQINLTGTLNVLTAAREHNVKRVVFASSSAVYGSNTTNRRNKETNLPHPESPYAVAKLASEHYCSVFSRLFGLSTISLRFFNVYGPYSRAESMYSLVIPIFIKNLLQNKTPTVDWHGRQSRDFIHVTDVAKAALLAATHPHLKGGQVFNIGFGSTTSINQLLQLIQTLLKTNFPPSYQPKRAGDVLTTFADTTKAKDLLGFSPTISLTEGLSSSISWYKQNAQHPAIKVR